MYYGYEKIAHDMRGWLNLAKDDLWSQVFWCAT